MEWYVLQSKGCRSKHVFRKNSLSLTVPFAIQRAFFLLFLLNNAWFCLSSKKALFTKIFQMLFYTAAHVCEEKVIGKRNSFQLTLKI